MSNWLLGIAMLSVAFLAAPASAEIKGYDENLSDSVPAVIVDVDPGDGSRGVPPEYSTCPAQPNPVNTVFSAGFTSGYAFVPAGPVALAPGGQPAGAPADATLYGLEFQGTDVFLYTVADEFCATGARVGTQPVGHPNLESLAYSCHDGFLYSVAFDTEAHEGYLIRIDPATGIGVPVGAHRMARDVWIVGLVYDDQAGSFAGITNGFAGRDFQELYRITLAGLESLVGATGTESQLLQSLVMAVDGRLLAGGRRLYEIDPVTGEASPLGSLEFPGTLWALANRDLTCDAAHTPTVPASPRATPTPTSTRTPTRDAPTATATPRRTAVTTGRILPADTTILVEDIRGLPERGTMRINDEIISYDGVQVMGAAGAAGDAPVPGALLNVQRGVAGTTPAEHPPGSVLILLVAECGGDCDGDRRVAVNELITGVNIALGNAVVDVCRAMDGNADGAVSISELIRAVSAALDGCV